MVTEARIGKQTLFQTSDDASPESWTTFAEVTSVTPISFSRDSIDASHELSPDEFREFIPGMVDPGEVTIEFNFIPGNSSLLALVNEFSLTGGAGQKTRRIQFPDTSTWEFEAFVTGFSAEAPLDDKMSASATFKLTGKPVLTQAS